MKICPNCRAQFEDDMNFCLQDGTPLIKTEQFSNQPLSFDQTLNLPTVPNLPPTIPQTQGFYPPPNQPPNQQQTIMLSNQPTASRKVETSPVLGSLTADLENSKSRSNSVIAAVAGILLLLGTAVGGVMWFSKSGNEADSTSLNSKNINSSTPVSQTSDYGLSNTTTSTNSNNQSETNFKPNSNSSRLDTPKLANTAKQTPITESEEKERPKVEIPERSQTEVSGGNDYPSEKVEPSTPKPVPKTIAGGVVNGKATNLVKPPYPAAARAVRASGAVNVQVTIDESGNVISATAVSGHPLLRAASVQAARSSKFSPTMLSGQPVKVTGIIVYNFVP